MIELTPWEKERNLLYINRDIILNARWTFSNKEDYEEFKKNIEAFKLKVESELITNEKVIENGNI